VAGPHKGQSENRAGPKWAGHTEMAGYRYTILGPVLQRQLHNQQQPIAGTKTEATKHRDVPYILMYGLNGKKRER
jgi:hypothetical protein